MTIPYYFLKYHQSLNTMVYITVPTPHHDTITVPFCKAYVQFLLLYYGCDMAVKAQY